MSITQRADSSSFLERLRMGSDEGREYAWSRRTAEDAQAFYRLPNDERYSMLPSSMRRTLSPCCCQPLYSQGVHFIASDDSRVVIGWIAVCSATIKPEGASSFQCHKIHGPFHPNPTVDQHCFSMDLLRKMQGRGTFLGKFSFCIVDGRPAPADHHVNNELPKKKFIVPEVDHAKMAAGDMTEWNP